MVCLALLPGVGFLLYTDHVDRDAASAGVLGNTLLAARTVAFEQARHIAEVRTLLRGLAETDAVRGHDSSACTAALRQVMRQHAGYALFAVADPDGFIRCSGLEIAEPIDVRDRGWFTAAVETGRFTVSDYQIGRITGRATLNFGYPFVTRGGSTAVTMAAVEVGRFAEIARPADLPSGSVINIFDREGTVLVRQPNPGGWVGKRIPDHPVVQAARTMGEGMVRAPGLDGVDRIWGLAPILAGGDRHAAHIAIGIPVAVAFGGSNRLLTRGLLGIGLTVVIALAGTFLAARRLVLAPVDALVRATREFAAGRLDRRMTQRAGSAEMGQLAQAFNEMADGLAARQATLVQREAHFRALIEHAQDIITILDGKGTILYQSPSVERVLGYRPDELQGVQALELVHPDDRERIREALAHAAQPGAVVATELRFRRADGGWRVLEGFGTNLLTEPSVGGIVFNSRDVTDRNEAMASVQRQRETLLEREKLAALGRLAAGVAHELKNPLTVITMRAQLLKLRVAQGTVSPADVVAPAVDSLIEAGERMRRIMVGLSSYSKPSKPEPRLISPRDVLHGVRELVAYQARTDGVVLEIDAPDGLPLVLAEQSELTQIFVNLATNAIEALTDTGREATTGAGTVVLGARVEATGEGEVVVMKVADTGPGIPPDRLQTIWEAFYTTKRDGTGLGLSIVQSLVERQPGATVTVASEVGRGTTFSIRMPARH